MAITHQPGIYEMKYESAQIKIKMGPSMYLADIYLGKTFTAWRL